MNYLIDSSAWIEYLEGSGGGERVSKFLKEGEIFSLSLNIAEVISKVKRSGKDFNLAYKVITSNSKVLEISPQIAKESGLLHAEIKKNKANFGLIDAIILISTRMLKANLVTQDNHFKGFKEAILIR
jgi:predicted nucleic acid-binding protein